MRTKLNKVLSLALALSLLFQQIGFAQIATELNIASHLSRMASSLTVEKFRPAHLRYFSYDIFTNNFKVLLDKGDTEKGLSPQGTVPFQEETQTLLNYFLVGVTLPDSMFWVNLRPDSEDQIIDQYLEKTDVGRIMLEADLQLKKDTSAMTSPATPEGREYWDRLYKKAADLYGYDNVTIPTLTRPWIVPGEIIVRESKDSAYIYKATLKVMLEQDYLQGTGDRGQVTGYSQYQFKDSRSKALNEYSTQLIKELIIPKLTKEVNSSKRYAPLRQVYYSLILSRWFKQRFVDKKGLSPQGTVPSYSSLIDSKNLTNLISKQPWSKTTYFQAYQKSFSQGEYSIQEPVYTPTGQVIRSYFSGGIQMGGAGSPINNRSGVANPAQFSPERLSKLGDLMEGDSRGRIKVVATSPEQASNSSPIEKSGSKPIVLIVDDDRDNRWMIKHELKRQGFEPDQLLEAKNGKEALEILKNKQVALVLSDYNMPEMDGGELYEKISENKDLQAIPFVMLTGGFPDSVRKELKLPESVQIFDKYAPFAQVIYPVISSLIKDKERRRPSAASPEQVSNSSPVELNFTKGFKKILVVEDDSNTRNQIQRILKAQYPNAEVIVALSAQEAIDIVSLYGQQIDIVLSDYQLEPSDPYMSWENMTQEERYRNSAIPIIEKIMEKNLVMPVIVHSAAFDEAKEAVKRKVGNRAEVYEKSPKVFLRLKEIQQDQATKSTNPTAGSPMTYAEAVKVKELKNNEELRAALKGIKDIAYSAWGFKAKTVAEIADWASKSPRQVDVYIVNIRHILNNAFNNNFPLEIDVSYKALVGTILRLKVALLEVRRHLDSANFKVRYGLSYKIEATIYLLSRMGAEEITLSQALEKIIEKAEKIVEEHKELPEITAAGAEKEIREALSGIRSVYGEKDVFIGYDLEQKKKTAAELSKELDAHIEVIASNLQRVIENKIPKDIQIKIKENFASLKNAVDELSKTLKGLYYNDRQDEILKLFSKVNLAQGQLSQTLDKAKKSSPGRRISSPIMQVPEGASSAVESIPKTTGGIDFRVLPMTIQPMGSFSGLNFKLPRLSQADLARMDIEVELAQIQRMASSGILPSGERVKELIAACIQKQKINAYTDRLLLCLIDIFKLQELDAVDSSPALREALVLVDAMG